MLAVDNASVSFLVRQTLLETRGGKEEKEEVKEVTLDSEAMASITRITSMATSPSNATSKPTHAQDLNGDLGRAEEQVGSG